MQVFERVCNLQGDRNCLTLRQSRSCLQHLFEGLSSNVLHYEKMGISLTEVIVDMRDMIVAELAEQFSLALKCRFGCFARGWVLKNIGHFSEGTSSTAESLVAGPPDLLHPPTAQQTDGLIPAPHNGVRLQHLSLRSSKPWPSAPIRSFGGPP